MRVNGLRRQADMPHHRNLRLHQRSHQARALASAFKLHGLGAAFLDEANRVLPAPFRR